jgi:hypothetical protein
MSDSRIEAVFPIQPAEQVDQADLMSQAQQKTAVTRRHFVGALAATGVLSTWTAHSYASIAGANERVQFAVAGLNSRDYAHLSTLQANRQDARITHVCDVDTTILAKFADKTKAAMNEPPQADQDFRHALDSKDVDVNTIATPGVAVTLMQLANISCFTGRGLHIDATNGSIQNDKEAEAMTRRTYEKGWEPKV